MITVRQIEYLLLFATQSSCGRYIANAAEEFGVTKATASQVSTALEREGLIRKRSGNKLELTAFGWAYITPKVNQMKRIEKWMEIGLGLLPNQAEKEARRMVASLQNSTIDAMIHHWLCCGIRERQDGLSGFFRALAPGVYQVPFQVYKKDKCELSMGDRGFRKPARLIQHKNSCFFLLYPVQLQYYSTSGKGNTGVLERLWYQRDGSWYEAEEYTDGGRVLRSGALTCVEELDGVNGFARIRARSTLSIVKMPESEADIVFDLSHMKPE